MTENILDQLDRVIHERATSEGDSYTQKLLRNRNLRMKKIGEEAAEFVLSCADNDKSSAVEEAADIIYHVLVALHGIEASWKDVEAVLMQRAN